MSHHTISGTQLSLISPKLELDRRRIMQKFLIFTIALIGAVAAAPQVFTTSAALQLNSTCYAPVPKTCDFYFDCLDKAHPCGADGYAQSYGGKFCRRFKENAPLFSEIGQKWLWNVMSCLQGHLIPTLGNANATCDAIRKDAFKSHAGCYLNTGISICDIPILDWLHLVKTVGFPTLIEIDTLSMEVQVGGKCAIGYLKDVLNFFGHI
ncbi:hypothetical protein HDU97_000605 [Phlyctochytrium planicorne]|nr:hypothetical protein HDU97_000605 [Phlyctochytrium planicorne]